MLLCTAQQMRDLDSETINTLGLPGVVLMENAGRATVAAMAERYGELAAKKILILAGPGNNGGDGLVMARHLHQLGAQVTVCLLVADDAMQGDAAINLSFCRKLPIPFSAGLGALGPDINEYQILVDALFGTGLGREIGGDFARAISLMNESAAQVVAVDIPSGVDSDTGQIWGCGVQADLTCTYGLAKVGQVQYPGRELVGQLQVLDIGIPPQLVAEADIKNQLMNHESAKVLLPQRSATGHKGSHGHLAIVAGSVGMSGAATLTGRGALHGGAGLVSLLVPQRLQTIMAASCPEALTHGLSGLSGQALGAGDWPEIEVNLQGKDALVLGPGLGLAPETAELVNTTIGNSDLPLVLDADGLNNLDLSALKTRAARSSTILTPHPGEMARLLGVGTAEVQAKRLQLAQELATSQQVIVVLKGAGTVIAGPDGRLAINSSGNSGMGSGGMGDVLAGLIGALLAQGLDGFAAACLGAFLHGRAGDLLSENGQPWGYLASELAKKIPTAVGEL
ncbi:MAG: NAD(P)H-hydrate dehydratase, partial [Thermodesulfobacteriota bacterium]